MPNVTDHPERQHPPGLPEPSYARRTLEAVADNLWLSPFHDNLLSDSVRRRAFNVAVATTVTDHRLPDAVANEVSEKVAHALPPIADGITQGQYALQLRRLAEAV